MNDSRKKMLDKVRAILAKTMDNGCTEDEAMTALAKARELMATYDIDETELNVKQEAEKAKIIKGDPTDPYGIKKTIAVAVGRLTRTLAFNDARNNTGINFVGLESDVIFASWLLETLRRFVMRALRNYQADRSKKRIQNSNHLSVSFVIGCAERIREKLRELTPVETVGNGLVVSRKALIMAELERNGITLNKGRKSTREVDPNAAKKGFQAGNSARFDRPVGQGGRLMLK